MAHDPAPPPDPAAAAAVNPPAADPPDICLFAQYHQAATIPPHTRFYLAHLAACGWRLHVACSGAAALAPPDRAFLAAIGATGHPRPNHGLDFGAWAALLREGCARGAGRILFANDSVFGPFADLRPIFARMAARNLDAWGMVESRERVWHLQSWFVCLTAAALARPAVARVFAQDFNPMDKNEIILHGELGLGVALRAEALATAAVWPERSRLRRLIPVNPSHFDWRPMLQSGAVPFLKIELLRDNPANLASIAHWRGVVARLPNADPAADPAAIDSALAAQTGRPPSQWRPPLRPAPLIRRALNRALTAAGRPSRP